MEIISPTWQNFIKNPAKLKEAYPGGYAFDFDRLSLADKPFKLNRLAAEATQNSEIWTSLLDEIQIEGYSQASQLKKLKDPKTQVVVTGQQPGLWCGSLMVWYKAATAVALAQKLEKLWQRPVLPVFWIAGDDTDLAECNRLEVLSENKVHQLEFSDAQEALLMSERQLSDEHLDHLREWMGDKDTPPEHYSSRDSLSQGMRRMLLQMFPELLVIDGAGQAVQKSGQKTLQKLAENAELLNNSLAQQVESIQELGLGVQVPIRPDITRVMQIRNGRRQRVKIEDVPQILAQKNARLSHDVLSRPIVTEALFGVQAHILGPGEFNYFALLKPLYEFLEIEFPAVAPRAHATVLRPHEFSVAKELKMPAVSLKALNFSDYLEKYGRSLLSQSVLEDQWLQWNSDVARGLSGHASGLKIMQKLSGQIRKQEESIRKKLCRTVGADQKEFAAMARSSAQWLGQGRKQERLMSLPDLGWKNLVHILKQLEPLDVAHQYLEIP